jgi:hypothetical protein
MSDTNLITLCRMHHEMAESGEIDAEKLKELVQNIPPEGQGWKSEARNPTTPPSENEKFGK